VRKIKKPDKFGMNQNLSVKTPKGKGGRRRTQRRPRQPRKAGKVTVKRVAAQGAPRRKRRNPQKRGGARLNGGGIVGIGNTRGRSMGKNSMTVSESEFVAAVTVANQPNFNNVQFAINPGNATLFPWLATIASRFEKYTFTRLNFIYKKEVSEFNTAGSSGKVVMSVDFDASDPAPTNKQQMLDTVPHADAMSSQSFGLSLNPRDLAHPSTIARYVRIAGLPGATDIKTYDVGNFNIATQGVTVNGEVGELHVSYTVRFEKPVLEATTAPTNLSVSVIHSATGITPGSGAAGQITLDTFDTNGLGLTVNGGVVSFPAGNYLIDVISNFINGGANQTVEQLNYTAGAGLTLSPINSVSHPVFSSPALTQVQLDGSLFASSTGAANATLALQGTCIFGAGTTTITGQLRVVAI